MPQTRHEHSGFSPHTPLKFHLESNHHDPPTRNPAPHPPPRLPRRRRASPAHLPPLGGRTPARRPRSLAVPRRRSPHLLPRHRSPRHGPRRRVALVPPPPHPSRPTHRLHLPHEARQRQPRLLARPPLAAPGPHDRSHHRRHRLLVQRSQPSRDARRQSRRQHRLPPHLRKERHAPRRHRRTRLRLRTPPHRNLGHH